MPSEQPAEGSDKGKVKKEEWKEVKSNPETQFKDSVKCDDNPSTTARITTMQCR
jgi:hypothetical protein